MPEIVWLRPPPLLNQPLESYEAIIRASNTRVNMVDHVLPSSHTHLATISPHWHTVVPQTHLRLAQGNASILYLLYNLAFPNSQILTTYPSSRTSYSWLTPDTENKWKKCSYYYTTHDDLLKSCYPYQYSDNEKHESTNPRGILLTAWNTNMHVLKLAMTLSVHSCTCH